MGKCKDLLGENSSMGAELPSPTQGLWGSETLMGRGESLLPFSHVWSPMALLSYESVGSSEVSGLSFGGNLKGCLEETSVEGSPAPS